MWLHFGTVLAQKVCRSQGRATASEATLWRPRQERRKTVWEEQPGFPQAVGHCSAAPKPVGTLYPPQRCPEYSSLSPGSHSQYVAPRNLILSPALNWLLFLNFQTSWPLSSLKLSSLLASTGPLFLRSPLFSLTTFNYVHIAPSPCLLLHSFPLSSGTPYGFIYNPPKLFSLNLKISSTNSFVLSSGKSIFK